MTAMWRITTPKLGQGDVAEGSLMRVCLSQDVGRKGFAEGL